MEKENSFLLPIYYTETFYVPEEVSADLELNETVYPTLLKPSHIFAQTTCREWSKVFTNDIDYLEDTQKVIQEIDIQEIDIQKTDIQKTDNDNTLIPAIPDYTQVHSIWREIHDDSDFIERYNYLEWDMLKHFNESASFLQSFSFIQILSPVLTLLMPIFILLFPFLLMQFHNQPITFESYMMTLKTIAKNHFIGKLLHLNSLDIQNLIYVFISIAFYLFSTYQNIVSTVRFYTNIKTMNSNLYTLKQYLQFVCPRMESFVKRHREKPKYTEFCNVVEKNYRMLKDTLDKFTVVSPFSHSILTFNKIGEMLKLYYQLYHVKEWKETIEYSFGFEGYIDNISVLKKHVNLKDISFSQFKKKKTETDKTKTDKTETETTETETDKTETVLKNQYYPCHLGKDFIVKNDVYLKKNIIITGPNASGKTTYIKSVVLNILLSQQFGCGCYDSATIYPYTHIHSYLNIPDTSERDSLFQAESRRCKTILDNIREASRESHHLCIFDELYSGTNYKDATKSATSFLKYLSKHNNVDYLLTTHYTKVCRNLKKEENIQLCKMDVDILPNASLNMKYKIKGGISNIEGGIHILREMNYPDEIIQNIIKQ